MDSRYPEGVMENLLMNLRFENGVVGRVLAVFGLVEPPQTMNGLARVRNGGHIRGGLPRSSIASRACRNGTWSSGPRQDTGNEVLRYMRRFEECVAACSAARGMRRGAFNP